MVSSPRQSGSGNFSYFASVFQTFPDAESHPDTSLSLVDVIYYHQREFLSRLALF